MFSRTIRRVSSIFGSICCMYASILGDEQTSLIREVSIGVHIFLPYNTSNGLKPNEVVVVDLAQYDQRMAGISSDQSDWSLQYIRRYLRMIEFVFSARELVCGW